MDMLFTANPIDINYVFSKNFSNYGKGQNFRAIFEVLGDGVFNTDDALWQYHRKLNHSFLGHPKFRSTFVNTIRDEIDCRLIPLFNHISKNDDIKIDLQDVFIRFTFDVICTILTNDNPKFLSNDLPPIPFLKVVADVEEVIFKRHLVPPCIWKSLRWLGVGEKKYKEDCNIADDFLYTSIAKWRSNKAKEDDTNKVSFDLLKFMDEDINAKAPNDKRNDDKFLRDTILGVIVAGGNTTSVALSWFFYLLSKYPQVSSKIRDELNTIVTNSEETIDEIFRNFNEHSNKLLYLHAAICETLRLYPPVAYNHKASITSDILPSGHQIHRNTIMLFDVYAMGRMESIWGDDCNEFKPERWITKRGNIEVIPSNKFLSFGAGPRVCQGKDESMTQMKIVVVAIVSRYDVEMRVRGY